MEMKVYISNLQKKKRLNIPQIERDCRKALRLLGLQRAELSVLFVGGVRMRRLNRKFRGVDSPTDVISFPMYESQKDFPSNGPFIPGDIAINIPMTALQAKRHGLSFIDEIRRLLIHGLLHLLGYDHERSKYAELKMRKKERELLGKLSPKTPY